MKQYRDSTIFGTVAEYDDKFGDVAWKLGYWFYERDANAMPVSAAKGYSLNAAGQMQYAGWTALGKFADGVNTVFNSPYAMIETHIGDATVTAGLRYTAANSDGFSCCPSTSGPLAAHSPRFVLAGNLDRGRKNLALAAA